MLEELTPKPSHPKKQNILVRVLIFLMTIALMLGAVALVVARDKINFDSIRRYLTYRSLTAQGEHGAGQPFAYDGGPSAAMAGLDGDLLCVSSGGVRLYDAGGATFIDETVSLEHPAVAVTDGTAVVYDAGGTFLKVYRNRAEVFCLEPSEDAILSARLNDAGWLAVVTRGVGYKGIVTVYNAKFRPVMAVRLSSSFVMDAIVSPDTKTLAVVTAGQSNHTFESKLVTYPVAVSDSDAQAELVPIAELSLGNSVLLDLRWNGAAIRALTEQGLTIADATLQKLGGTDWTGEYLKAYAQIPSDYSVALIARHRAGNAARLVTVGTKGEILGVLEFHDQVLSLSAAGRYVAVLTAGRLELFTRDLEPYAESYHIDGARRAILREDGSVLLMDSESAWLFVPD